MFNHYRMIKKGQMKKKFLMYKMAFSVLIDFTIALYLIVFLGYFAFVIIKEGDLSQLTFNFQKIEAFTAQNIWNIAIVFPVIHFIRGINDPGVIFATAEYKQLHLPVSRHRVWLMCAIERWVGTLIKFSFVGVVFAFLSSTSFSMIVFYVSIIVVVNMLMTVIGWKFFQLHVVKKIAIIFLYLAVVVGAFFIDSAYVGMGGLLGLGLINLMLISRLFQGVNWQKVVSASDFRLWNLPLISYVSKEKMKKQAKYSQWRVIPGWWRPFHYDKQTVYHRLWIQYFEKNIIVILQLFGGLSFALFIFIFFKTGFFLTVFAITIWAISSVSGAMFVDRLKSDVVHVLPWDMEAFKQTLKIWIFSFSTIILLPFFVYVIVHKVYLFPLHLFIAITALNFSLESKFSGIEAQYDVNYVKKELFDLAAFCLLIGLAFTTVYPALLGVGAMIAVLMIVFKGKDKHRLKT